MRLARVPWFWRRFVIGFSKRLGLVYLAVETDVILSWWGFASFPMGLTRSHVATSFSFGLLIGASMAQWNQLPSAQDVSSGLAFLQYLERSSWLNLSTHPELCWWCTNAFWGPLICLASYGGTWVSMHWHHCWIKRWISSQERCHALSWLLVS